MVSDRALQERGSLGDAVYYLKGRPWFALLGLAPAVCLFLVMVGVPMLLLGEFSFYKKLGGQFVFDRTPSLYNYVRFVSDPFFLGVLGNTLVLAVAVTALCLLLGYPVAYGIARAGRWRKVLLLLMLVPFLVSHVIKTFGWMLLLSNQGVVNWLIQAAGLTDRPLPLLFNMTGTIIGMTHILLPYVVIILEGVIRGIDPNLDSAARSLGAGDFRAFREVTWPLSRPGLLAGSLLVFSLSVAIFTTVAIMGGGKVQVMSTVIYSRTMFVLDWPMGAAMSWILLIVTGLITAGYQRFVGRLPWRSA